MTDQPDLPTPGDDEPYPWEGDPPPEEAFGPDGRRLRHDAFTDRRKHDFLKALIKTGCIEDACRATGVGRRTVYRHQQDDPLFFDHCRIALRMSAAPIELTAWARAVEGVEQEFACGGQVHVRRRYDGGLLRLLLQGSNPKKYGPNPGFKRKRLLRHERKQMAREIRAEVEARRAADPNDVANMPIETVREEIVARLDRIRAHDDRRRVEEGWTRTPDGHWIPPGYGPLEGWTPPASPGVPARLDGGGARETGGETPRDSV